MNDLKSFWKNKDKRKGILTTVIAHTILFLIFLFFGFTEMIPKPEEGIIINFGYTETGSGNTQNTGAPTPQTEQQDNSSQTETPSTEQTQDPVLTQDVFDAPSIDANKSNSKPKEEKPVEKPVEKPKPSSELSDLLNQVENSKAGGEGVAGGPGDQGDPTGDPSSPNRIGGGGGGNGTGNYILGNRQALDKPKPTYECPDQGRVVVKIYVSRDGKVSRATPGEQIPGGAGSTTTSSCLYAKARAAAMNTRWQSDDDAPSLQTGYIVYNFTKK